MKLKHTILLVSMFGVWSANSLAIEPETENDKAIYSLGYELGKDIKRQELKLTSEILLQGATDAIEGNKPLVNSRERQKALKAIKVKRTQENLEKSQAYLAENGKKEGVLTLESGLQYKVIQAGEGKTPGATDTVTVHYRGTLIDGAQFDSSHDRGKPSTFKVNKIIKGWSEALQLMKEGAKWELTIPPELGYGKRGRKPIPSNSALLFEVELISVKQKSSTKNQKKTK
ncbi:MAG: FKBP-type peptidyl-prolyl cis-trans isomerase [Pseudomonadota bacterium]